MDTLDLLDGKDALEIKIISFLISKKNQVSKKKLLQKFSVSEKTLVNLVDSINIKNFEIFKFSIIQYSDSERSFKIEDIVEVYYSKILTSYIINSINFKIIDLTFKKYNSLTQDFPQLLLISRANFFRRLKDINIFLQEFGICIRANSFVGNELQILHFRQMFYQEIYLEKKLSDLISNIDQIEELVLELEKHFQVKFEAKQKAKLLLWCSWYFERKNCRHNEECLIVKEFVNTKLSFKDVREILQNFFLKYKINLTEYDYECTYIFMIAEDIYPKHSYVRKKILNESIIENDFISKKLLSIEKKVNEISDFKRIDIVDFYLYSLLVSVIFFKGRFTSILGRSHKNDIVNINNETYVNMISYFLNQVDMNFSKSERKYIAERYISYVNTQLIGMKKIYIGISADVNPIYEEFIVKKIIESTSFDVEVVKSNYFNSDQYDLVLTTVAPTVLD